MTPVLPEELSALMDGELHASRAREVEMQIANDPRLRAEFERLVETDARWRVAAASAAFSPTPLMLPHATASPSSAGTAVTLALALICLRLAPLWSESLALGLGLHAAAMAVVLAGLLWVARTDDSGGGAHA
jgi:anti-sigma factor RsiW